MNCILKVNYILFIYLTMNIIILASEEPKRLSDVFPLDYDKNQPPWTKGNPADVYLQLSVMDIDKIDDGSMEYSIQSYLGEIWKDHRLNLDSYLSDMNTTINFPTDLAKLLWVPDLVFDNTRHGVLFSLAQPNTIIKLLPSGYFIRSSRYNLIIGCQMDFRLYPIDIQRCFLKIASMANPDLKLLLHWIEDFPSEPLKSIILMNNIQPLKYMLEDPKSYKYTEYWTTGSYTYLYANFTFIRRLSGSVFNVYIPSTLVVSLSWISFWLDVEAVPARITLGVTSLLTLATQMVQAHSGLPPISYMTAMDVWLFACLIMVFSSLIEFAISYHLFISRKQPPLDSKSVHRISCITPKEEIRILKSRMEQGLTFKNAARKKSSKKSQANSTAILKKVSLDNISRKFFPVVFFVFAVVYWTYYLSVAK